MQGSTEVRRQEHDWAAFHGLLSEQVLTNLREPYEMCRESPEMARRFGIDPEEVTEMEFTEFFAALMEYFCREEFDEFGAVANATIIETEREGNHASVRFKMGDKEDEMEMVLIDGLWLIANLD